MIVDTSHYRIGSSVFRVTQWGDYEEGIVCRIIEGRSISVFWYGRREKITTVRTYMSPLQLRDDAWNYSRLQIGCVVIGRGREDWKGRVLDSGETFTVLSISPDREDSETVLLSSLSDASRRWVPPHLFRVVSSKFEDSRSESFCVGPFFIPYYTLLSRKPDKIKPASEGNDQGEWWGELDSPLSLES